MKPTLIVFFLALTGLTGYGLSAENKVRLWDLPPAVQKTVLVVEEQASLESIPAAARATIPKKPAGGKVTRVETVTQNAVTTCEAAYAKGGKSHVVTVRADGTEVK